jgi:type IV fimbrial biogenesis protein FimT
MRLQKGLTFTELLIGVGLIGVLAGLAIPAFQGMIEQVRAKTVADRIQAELNFARTEAVLRRRQVVVCRTHDLVDCAYIGSWSMGTMTFEDRNGDKIRGRDEPIIRVMNAADYGGMHLIDVGRRSHVSFRPDGRSGGTNMTLKLCSRGLDARRLLVISVGGRVRATMPKRDTTKCGQ